jgi:uncharacterized protein
LKAQDISVAEARRLALAAQGFLSAPKPHTSHWPAIKSSLDRIHLLQIDSVNVLTRSHYLPLFARLGHYDMAALDARTLASTDRHCFECWAHEASLVPMSLHPLMRWRMHRAQKGDGIYKAMDNFGREEKVFLRQTLKHIEKNGPIRAIEVPGTNKSAGGWWGWSKGKLALETLFDQGHITAHARERFERIYDVAERVIPSTTLNLPTPDEKTAFRTLIKLSAEALGVATELDLRDYFRLPVADARLAIAEAVENGSLEPVRAEGWKQQAYVARNTSIPKSAGGNALLSPFDPIVWNRDRAERLFNFHYRIELYTPQEKRKFGYYVLPFLQGEALTGRLCLKADRENKTLLVNEAHLEAGCDVQATAAAMAPELRRMAHWLGLQSIKLNRRGKLAPLLRRALR